MRRAGKPEAFIDELLSFVRSGERERHVPCGGCRACCWVALVEVHPGEETPEDLAHMNLEERDGKTVMKKRDDGACIHLGPAGCSIHAHRPLVCRHYDCRIAGIFGFEEEFEAGHRPPQWAFDEEPEDLAVLIAWRNANTGIYLRMHEDRGRNFSADQWRELLPQARAFVRRIAARQP